MEPLEFLGGRYQQPEQIVPGDVQTFRAREAASGRSVFIHRISKTSSDPEQISLLRMLLACMFRSPSARNQILDFSDEPGFCYVVTESSPQCLLLREWLQFEIDHSSTPTRVAQPDKGQAPFRASDLILGETRNPDIKLGGRTAGIEERPGIDTKTSSTQTARPGELPKIEPRISEPIRSEPPRTEPFRSEPSRSEPGEFTRFFKGGMPPATPARSSSSSQDAYRSQDRPSNPAGHVQRPNTPPPALPSRSEPGEFTKMFSNSPAAPTPYPAPPSPTFTGNSELGRNKAPDFSRRQSDLPSIFQSEPEAPKPIPSASQQPGEYTRIFGKGNAPPPVQAPSAVGTTSQTARFDDPLAAPAPRPAPAGTGPSEFTRVIQGSRPAQTGEKTSAPTSANPSNGGLPQAPSVGMPVGASLPMMGAPVASPQMSVHAPQLPMQGGMHMPTPTVQTTAQPAAPATGLGGNTVKLLILLGVLLLLAVVMVLFVVFSGHK